jgi:hypothetical protein
MISVKELVQSVSTTKIPQVEKTENITFVVDISGSTSLKFDETSSVLEKEMAIVYDYILSHPNNNYDLISFGSVCEEYKVNVLKEEGLVNLPELSPKGGTMTNKAFTLINERKIKPDRIILLTDGETHSSEAELKKEVKKFTDNKIKLEIVAVSTLSVDLQVVSTAQEKEIPGMDLINYLSNSVEKLNIYNKHHKDQPYEGASSSVVNKKSLTFMGVKISGFVHEFLTNLVVKLNESKGKINWGQSNMQFKQMLSEIGKLMSVYFVLFPQDHYFVNTIVEQLESLSGIDGMTKERIVAIIKYGFDCTKNEKPILYTNFDQHVKEKTVKLEEFKNAIDQLKKYGTTLKSQKTICMPTNGMCVINNGVEPMVQYLSMYPNSKDKYGNVYFPCDENSNDQAIRIAFRELCGTLGYKDNRGPEPAFYVLNEMSMMFIKGVDLTSEHMYELKKLAIIQTSMETMVSKDKYDGVGLYKQWKAGKTLPTHYSKPTLTHSSLFTNIKINPLELEEPLWWALMMTMLGLFEEQKHNYKIALESKGLNTKEEFLSWLRDNYADKINGTVNLFTLKNQPTSVFSLDNFTANDEVYVLKAHGKCNTQTHYSKEEINNFIPTMGCVWCHYHPTWADFDLVNVNGENQLEELGKLMGKSEKLYVPFKIKQSNPSMMVGNKKILINMIGITGSGKSTASKKMYDMVKDSGGNCLIVSSDKWAKKGFKGAQLQNEIWKEINTFDKLQPEKYKVLVMDICNENGPSKKCFNFDTSGYNTFNFFPNLDKNNIDGYQCWCLKNVLDRPAHTETSLYWLNPETAGVNTCVKVHNLKFTGIKKLLGTVSTLTFYETDNLNMIKQKMGTKAEEYAKYLESSDLDKVIEDLIKSTGYPL